MRALASSFTVPATIGRRFTICFLVLVFTVLSLPISTTAQADEDDAIWSSGDFSALPFRGIGPGISSGRIGDFAIDPRNHSHYYVAVCSGGVWETKNSGITYSPIFDDQGSYSIGCLALAPSNPDIVWVGTGENNSQRAVAYGDGIYKSVNGGRKWKNMGLERSMHIGRIVVHPTNPDIVYVAAMGPLWGPGGERGVYKTTDGGLTWELALEIDENTGVVDLQMDPRDPSVLYAASYQRRRHTWTLINGGPGSGIYKTTNAGQSWDKLSSGLPSGDIGRIGLAISPPNPDTIYAIIEAENRSGGFYRSTNGGIDWKKMNKYRAGSPQYYQEIVADPVNVDRVYSLDTFMQVTENGGADWSRAPRSSRHVDDHALWIDPTNTDHMIVGSDGGIYDTYDSGHNWRFAANLPVTQYYRVAVDYDTPFYNVYGGTQDNNTMGGPSRTTFSHGIANRDWYFTLGGDGFEPAIDPTNPNIVYCQWQYGNLCRYDRQNGELTEVQPQPAEGEVLKWNWNSPLLISPHNHKRLYYACQKVFRSDDMGNSWKRISEDLSSGVDRNKLEIMGKVWPIDAVAKNNSTSFYGSIVSLTESALKEGLLYAGTDDGQIQVSRDGGANWTVTNSFKNVPDGCYVSDVEASRFEEAVVYATFDNHKRDDFKPYVLKSTNYGKSWKSIASNLPEKGTAYSLIQDHVDPKLIFIGTEFAVFFTTDEGENWTQLDAGIPVIACRDLEIQRRENDLVIATFGRGFYILDDYTPLRNLSPEDLENDKIFPIKDSLIFNYGGPVGGGSRGNQGSSFYKADNPTFGAVITYNLTTELKTLESLREKDEADKVEAEETVYYPSWDQLRKEDRENSPGVYMSIHSADGKLVRRFNVPSSKGLHRVAWDLRHPSRSPVNLDRSGPDTSWDDLPSGPFAVPGTYSATITSYIRGQESVLAGPVDFKTKLLGNNSLETRDFAETVAFGHKVADLLRAVRGAGEVIENLETRLSHIGQAINDTPELDRALLVKVTALENRIADLQIVLYGDRTITSHSEPATPGLSSRVSRVSWATSEITGDVTDTQRQSLAIATKQFGPVLKELRQIVEHDIKELEDILDQAGAPYTPGRFPVWAE